MGRLGVVVASATLLVSTSAIAQVSGGPSITGVTTSANTLIIPGTPCFSCESGGITIPTDVGYGAGAAHFPNATYPSSAFGNAKWNSFVDNNVDAGTITFESSNTTGGQPIGAISQSTVAVGIANGSGLNLHSTITPAGMGFYVADAGDGSCILTGSCAQVATGSSYDFADFAAAFGDFRAFAAFEFTVVASADGFDDHTIYSVTGNLELSADGSLIVSEDVAEGFAKLSEFGLQTPPAGGAIPYHSLGYNWQETGFDAGGLFETSFQTITYRTSVFSYVNGPCLSGRDGVDAGVTACLVAYSGFGDPIGRGVSELAVADFSANLGVGDVELFNHGDNDLIDGVHFSPFTINTPRIVGNTLFVGGDVPEPATWAMMILGFGGIGAALRRRRMVGAHA
jgi:hypothetical protein